MRRRPALSLASVVAAIAVLGVSPGLAAAGDSTASPSTTASTAVSPDTTAAVSTTTAAPTTTTTAPPTSPPASVAPGKLSLYLPNSFVVHGASVTVPGRQIIVQGYVRPYVAGQKVTISSAVGHRHIATSQLRVKPAKGGRVGLFVARLRSPSAGIVRVTVTHQGTPQQVGFTRTRAVNALVPAAGFGARGLFVVLMQQRLSALHIYDPPTGVYDSFMGLAVDAYHRLLGHGVSQNLDGATISELLNGVGSFQVRFPHDGTHIEGNLGKQLLAEIYGTKVYRIYPISSGKPSTPTILGHFRVYQRTPGYLPDGMYYSSFFYGGYAIHGYDPAPDYPASHGCMRLPIQDAISVYDWLNYGDVVDVYL